MSGNLVMATTSETPAQQAERLRIARLQPKKRKAGAAAGSGSTNTAAADDLFGRFFVDETNSRAVAASAAAVAAVAAEEAAAAIGGSAPLAGAAAAAAAASAANAKRLKVTPKGKTRVTTVTDTTTPSGPTKRTVASVTTPTATPKAAPAASPADHKLSFAAASATASSSAKNTPNKPSAAEAAAAAAALSAAALAAAGFTPGSGKKQKGNKSQPPGGGDDDDGSGKQRGRRFRVSNAAKRSGDGSGAGGDDEDEAVYEGMAIVGTAQKVEKQYFRLTSAPLPSAVRPLPVLQKALELVKSRWLALGTAPEEAQKEYEYACDQLKSIRQDLTVQHIRTEFTTHVYETHARIALEVDDLAEFTQCQTQLKVLYDAGAPGKRPEFYSYRILRACQNAQSDLGIITFINQLKPEDRHHAFVEHALDVRNAVMTDNYYAFFRLYRSAPNMSAYLMDPVADAMRLVALRVLLTAYRPRIAVSHVTSLLAFASQKTCLTFLKRHSAVLVSAPDTSAAAATATATGAAPAAAPVNVLWIDVQPSFDALAKWLEKNPAPKRRSSLWSVTPNSGNADAQPSAASTARALAAAEAEGDDAQQRRASFGTPGGGGGGKKKRSKKKH